MRPISCLVITTLVAGSAFTAITSPTAVEARGFQGGGHAALSVGRGGFGLHVHAGSRIGWRRHGGFASWHRGLGRFGGRLGYGYGGYGYGGYGGFGNGSYGYGGYGFPALLATAEYGGGSDLDSPPAGSGGFLPIFMPVAIGIREAPVKPPALYVIGPEGRGMRRIGWLPRKGAATAHRAGAQVAVLDGANGDRQQSGPGPRIIRIGR